jgi:hypothetical protein
MARIVFYELNDGSGRAPLDLDDPALKRWVIDGVDPRTIARAEEAPSGSYPEFNREIIYDHYHRRVVVYVATTPRPGYWGTLYEEPSYEDLEDTFSKTDHRMDLPPELARIVEEKEQADRASRVDAGPSSEEIVDLRRSHCSFLSQFDDLLSDLIARDNRGFVRITISENKEKINKRCLIYNCIFINAWERPGGDEGGALFMTKEGKFLVAEWYWYEDDYEGYVRKGRWRLESREGAANWFGDEPELAPPVLRQMIYMEETESAPPGMGPVEQGTPRLAEPEVVPPQPETVPILDEYALADLLNACSKRKRRTGLYAKFVRFFATRTTSTFDELSKAIARDEDPAWETVKGWAYRTNQLLEEVAPGCGLHYSASVHGYLITKHRSDDGPDQSRKKPG